MVGSLPFQVVFHPNDMVTSEALVGVKSVDSGVVVRCQVGESTCTWSVEYFIAQSHIYPCFTGKLSTLTHFPFKPGCEDYSFLDQAVENFE